MSKIQEKMKQMENKANELKVKKRQRKLIKQILFALVLILFLVLTLFSKQIFGEDSWLALRTKTFDDVIVFFEKNASKIIDTAIYVAIIYVITRIIRMLLKAFQCKVKKGKAVVNLIDSFIKYVGFIIMLIVILKACGIDTSALITSIGVLGLTLGLGAQSLIEDIISGLFIVFERTFDVGDVVIFDGFRGTVKEIGLRTTKIIDIGGDTLTINNSDLRKIINMTSDLSVAICDVSIEYNESLERVENVLQRNLDKMKTNIPSIIEGPYYKGVNELADSGVIIRLIAKCNENDRYQTVRDMNREIKLIFDRNKINIPFPQVVINTREEEPKCSIVPEPVIQEIEQDTVKPVVKKVVKASTTEETKKIKK